MRLIDADALVDSYKRIESADIRKYHIRLLEAIIQDIESRPTVDRLQARWNEDDDGIWCSNCKAFLYFDENLKQDEKFYDYCPECGARMDLCDGRV